MNSHQRTDSMRTVHILRKFNPAEWGGTETAIQRLFEGLREHGVDPVVYCPRLEQESVDDPLIAGGYEVQRFRAFVPVLGMSRERKQQLVSVGGNLMSFDLIRSLWREDNVSIIHSHTLGRIGGIALTVARKRNVPFVVTIHGGVLDLPEKVKQTFNAPVVGGWEWGKLFGLLFRSHRLLADADAIITCNPREASLWQEKFPAKRVMVQPHGVPMAEYEKDCRQQARAAFPEIGGRDVLLSAGRVDPIKNQGWLLEEAPETFRNHPNAILVLAGACTDQPYGEQIGRRIRELGLEKRVLLTGGLPPNDPRLIGLMQEARALLLPSVSETFGLVILEAWAAGTLVLSSRTSGASALIEHGQNGWLFDLENPETFHEALARTLANPQSAREMVARGAAKVREQYSVNALASRMKGLYEELVEAKRCVT
jgi:glycosyltransferase involved in cell wall biosynthesis